jgi:hypothetical protein
MAEQQMPGQLVRCPSGLGFNNNYAGLPLATAPPIWA